MVCILAIAWASDGVDRWSWVRVEDPEHPEAIVRSETGSVLAAPPASGPWRWEPVAETDTVAWEALEVTNADLWHADGHGGAGVRIAVFDPGFRDASELELGAFSTHDCVAQRSCEVPFDPLRVDGKHGTACAEVVHDIAPEAELFLVRTTTFTSFENGVRWAIRNDIDLISMSVSFHNDSFNDGTGPFGDLLRELEAHDILLVTSAGNTAREQWRGRYVDADRDGRADFAGDNRLLFDVGAGDGRRVNLNWDQFGRCGDTDLDLVVLDADGQIRASSRELQRSGEEGCQPVERLRFDVHEPGRYAVEVHLASGGEVDVEMAVLTRGGAVVGGVPTSSVTIPADHPLAFAVGAVRAHDYLTAPTESFSSHGPNMGGWPKPDIAGPDRISTAAFGPHGFSGTSAATPAVAGLVAVRMAESGETPREASRWLQRHAIPDPPGPDERLGAGRARLPRRDVAASGCGRRPLILPLLLVPLWRRRIPWRR